MARDEQPAAVVLEGADLSLDRTSAEPAYAQVAAFLREKIARGDLISGQRLPSGPELAAAFGVAGMTVRQAVDLLIKEGVVARKHGRGTFIQAPDLSSAMFSLDDLRRQLTDPKLKVKILGARSVRSTPRVAGKLKVMEGERVISIKRLLQRDGEPLFYHSEYLISDARRPLVEVELGVTSLQGLFSGVGQIDVKSGHLVLHASALLEGEARYLGERPGVLAWVIEHLFRDFDDVPVSWGRFVCRADRLTFEADVGIFDEGHHGKEKG